MHEEHKEEIKMLEASIKHYKAELKRPAWKYIFSNENSHQIAERLIASYTKQLEELKGYYA